MSYQSFTNLLYLVFHQITVSIFHQITYQPFIKLPFSAIHQIALFAFLLVFHELSGIWTCSPLLVRDSSIKYPTCLSSNCRLFHLSHVIPVITSRQNFRFLPLPNFGVYSIHQIHYQTFIKLPFLPCVKSQSLSFIKCSASLWLNSCLCFI